MLLGQSFASLRGLLPFLLELELNLLLSVDFFREELQALLLQFLLPSLSLLDGCVRLPLSLDDSCEDLLPSGLSLLHSLVERGLLVLGLQICDENDLVHLHVLGFRLAGDGSDVLAPELTSALDLLVHLVDLLLKLVRLLGPDGLPCLVSLGKALREGAGLLLSEEAGPGLLLIGPLLGLERSELLALRAKELGLKIPRSLLLVEDVPPVPLLPPRPVAPPSRHLDLLEVLPRLDDLVGAPGAILSRGLGAILGASPAPQVLVRLLVQKIVETGLRSELAAGSVLLLILKGGQQLQVLWGDLDRLSNVPGHRHPLSLSVCGLLPLLLKVLLALDAGGKGLEVFQRVSKNLLHDLDLLRAALDLAHEVNVVDRPAEVRHEATPDVHLSAGEGLLGAALLSGRVPPPPLASAPPTGPGDLLGGDGRDEHGVRGPRVIILGAAVGLAIEIYWEGGEHVEVPPLSLRIAGLAGVVRVRALLSLEGPVRSHPVHHRAVGLERMLPRAPPPLGSHDDRPRPVLRLVAVRRGGRKGSAFLVVLVAHDRPGAPADPSVSSSPRSLPHRGTRSSL